MSHRDRSLPPGTRRVLHLDVDAFLASVEQALHPGLAGKPVVVGGAPQSRNLVMSCSYEARAFGVRPGMRSSEAARLCPRAIFREGDSRAANHKREEIVRVLLEFSPRVEVASIDDFFVDLTGATRLLGAAWDVATALRAQVRARTRMPLSIGIATNRTMARLAGKLAKPGGVAEILPGGERALLAQMPVRHLPGVGHRAAALLDRFAIRTVGALALVSREVLFATFGPLGLVLHDRARGLDPDPVVPSHVLQDDGRLVARPPKTIRRDSTFEPEEGRREHVEAMLAYLVERAAAHLRAHASLAGAVEVRLVHVDTRPPHLRRLDPTREPSLHKRARLDPPTATTSELAHRALELLRALPRRRALVKRVGLTLHGLRAQGGHQGWLFSDPERDRTDLSHLDRQHRLDATLDALRARHGFGGVVRGSQLPLAERFPLGRDGFQLRTPSLNQ